MSPKKAKTSPANPQLELLRNMVIAQLALAGVPQQSIRAVVGGDITKVNRVVRLLQLKKKNRKGGK